MFETTKVNLEVLRKRAFNYRWAIHEQDVIPLTAADPDFPVAEPITDAIKVYLKPRYFSYGAPQGDNSFRQAIANWYQRTKQVTVNPDFVLPVNSAAYGLFTCAKAILQPGEEAIIPDPVDFLFRKSIEAAGGRTITCKLNKDTAEFDLESLKSCLTPKTKALFICNPNNPLGLALSRTHLQDILDFAEAHDLWLVADEIWADINFNNSFTSAGAIHQHRNNKLMIVSGLSKNFALAGLRIGYVITFDSVATELVYSASAHATTAHGISVLSQVAGTAALTDCDAWLTGFQEHLRKMRELSIDFSGSVSFLKKAEPDATYLIFPQLTDQRKNATELVADILKQARVALIPGGTQWFESQSEGHLRICYATSEEILTEAFHRIRKYEQLLK